jgi:hypothetical protein
MQLTSSDSRDNTVEVPDLFHYLICVVLVLQGKGFDDRCRYLHEKGDGRSIKCVEV